MEQRQSIRRRVRDKKKKKKKKQRTRHDTMQDVKDSAARSERDTGVAIRAGGGCSHLGYIGLGVVAGPGTPETRARTRLLRTRGSRVWDATPTPRAWSRVWVAFLQGVCHMLTLPQIDSLGDRFLHRPPATELPNQLPNPW
jgi:hypothetical protein